jgi:hypothetical protein
MGEFFTSLARENKIIALFGFSSCGLLKSKTGSTVEILLEGSRIVVAKKSLNNFLNSGSCLSGKTPKLLSIFRLANHSASVFLIISKIILL